MTQRRIIQDECPYFVTFNTRDGEAWFEEGEYAKALAQTIRNATRLKGWTILAYQIMPNHVHLLTMKNDRAGMIGDRAATESRARGIIKLTPPRVSAPAVIKPTTISDFMYTVKSYYLETLRKHHDIRHSIWQPRFHTRIVSTRKYLETVTAYMQNNPIKDGLPKQYSKPSYQFFDWNKIHDLF